VWGLRRKAHGGAQPVLEAPPPVVALEDQARALAEVGRYRDALDALGRVRAEGLDTATLCDHVLWRRAAFDPEAGRPQWPPRAPDPFPGVQQIPEIGARDLTADILGGAIQHHGALIVRGMIDAAQNRALTEIIEQAFATAAAARAGADGATRSPWYCPFPLDPADGASGRDFTAMCGAIWAADSPRALFDFIAFLKTHGVTQVIEDYLGERAFLSLRKCTLRQVPPTTGANWHQDGAFLGDGIRTVNLWLTLSDCGEDAPGLDVYPRRLNALAEMGTRGAFDWWTVGDGVVEDMAKTVPVYTPTFKAGDAMLFDQLFLHRTGVRPGMTRERLAIESWFFAGSTFPMDQVPIAL